MGRGDYGACDGSVAQLLERFAVVDLEVSDPPIEQIIGGLFERGRVDDSPA